MRPGGLRPHLSYANVMATVAVFIALGGSAYAVKRIDGKVVITTPRGTITSALEAPRRMRGY